jgi:4-amino-4-deoxy-L-arabinose transferase-like glycosyltransferase
MLKKYTPLFLIITAALFFKLYHLERNFSFQWDQARDAQVVWDIVRNGKFTLIGPRAIGPDSFFLGPLWYYLLVPFYLITDMNPIGAAVFGAVVGISTTVLLYLTVKKFYGITAAIVAGIIWATFPDRSVFNPILIPFLSTLILFMTIMISEGKSNLVPLVILVFGLSMQIHFQSIVFIIPIILSIYFYYLKKGKFPLRSVFVGLFLLLLTFLPIIAFDMRHNLLNLRKFASFVNPSNNQLSIIGTNFFLRLSMSFTKFVNAIVGLFPEVNSIFPNYSMQIAVFLIFLSLLSIILFKISKQRKILMLSLFILPPVLFSIYKGDISEYYFSFSTVPFIIGLSFFFVIIFENTRFIKYVLIVFLFLFVVFRADKLLHTQDLASLYYQKEAVGYIVNQSMDPVFNVSYDVPVNEDAGYKYLFTYYGKEPQDVPEGHLWTIMVPYRNNVNTLAVFGNIGVVRR